MGLTERHWFEDEEPKLTENQLEDILWEHNKIFEKGYQKGFFDGKSAILREQNAVKPREQEETRIWTVCGNCSQHLISKWLWCPYCGRKVQWE